MKHLPYNLDEEQNRYEYYENYWKRCGLELLQKHFPPGEVDSVLDDGCGRGEALQIFGERGYKVIGTDTDPQCVELAGEHGDAVPLNIEDPVAQFGEKSHDVVICFHVLEHVSNPREVASQFSRIARKAVVVAVPNLRTLVGLFKQSC